MSHLSSSPESPGGVEELRLLFEISQRLDRGLDLDVSLGAALDALIERGPWLRAGVTLVNRDTGDLELVEARGMTERQQARGRYSRGEGVTGRVIDTGEPVVVPVIAEDDAFLNRTRARSARAAEDLAFLCVPIKVEGAVIGALGADRPTDDDPVLQSDVRLLSIVTSLLAQAVQLRQAFEEERSRLETENERLRDELRERRLQPTSLIGTSKPMLGVFDVLGQVAPSSTTVLILGESGTGKELIAQAIHEHSTRSSGAFVRVNCGALPEAVVESELFGHERGAFTGAIAQRKGRFELADGGTIFLDEVGELTAMSQVKLLRVLQEREFERVGGTRTLSIDVRVIAATSRDLEAMVDEGTFRRDLYYRLAVFPIVMPPLCERGTDVIALADHFVAKFNRRHLRNVRRISTAAIDMLVRYHWPGNVRELENCIERAVLLSTDDVIHGHHLPPSLQTAESTGTGFAGTLKDRIAQVEREWILDALKSTNGNMAAAARQLGITERQMGLRVKRYDIDPRRFKSRGR